MMQQLWLLLALLAITNTSAFGQSYPSLVDDGNDAYEEKKYDEAESSYKQGIREKPERIEGHFNLGNAEYRKSDIQAALDAYKNAATKAKSKSEVAQTLYNVGNAYLKAAESGQSQAQQAQGGSDMQMQGYKQAIEAYKQSLKLDPKDADSRYNLVYAMKKLEELQKQNQNKDQKQDKKDDKKDDKKENQDQKNQDQKKDDQKKDQQKNDQQQNQDKKDQQQSKPKEQKMSKEQAEQILKALERDEKDLQKKVRAQQSVRVNVDKDW